MRDDLLKQPGRKNGIPMCRQSTPHVPICRKKQVLGALACRHSLGSSNPCESAFYMCKSHPKKTHADLERTKGH